MRFALLALVACGSAPAVPISKPSVIPHEVTGTDPLLPLLPDGAQIVVEVDVARLRANPTVGAVVAKALAQQVSIPGVAAPLGQADQVVLAAYGVGTAQAATLTLLASKTVIPDLAVIAPGVYGIGPPDWLASAQQRAGLATSASTELYTLRDHAMPKGAPGASLRITARLSFDARVALARQTGLPTAPSQLSLWADVADDLAIVIDADGADGKDKDAAKRLEAGLKSGLAQLAGDPALRALGIPSSLEGARFVAQGTWVRAIIAIGPAHLHRIVERATALLGAT
jgi:hypothetical protein